MRRMPLTMLALMAASIAPEPRVDLTGLDVVGARVGPGLPRFGSVTSIGPSGMAWVVKVASRERRSRNTKRGKRKRGQRSRR